MRLSTGSSAGRYNDLSVTRPPTKNATTQITAVATKQPANGHTPPSGSRAEKTIAVIASAIAAPIASEIESAELLKPWFSSDEYSSVMTVNLGYIRPMPAPASAQPAIATRGSNPNTEVASDATIATTTRTAPIRMLLE